MTDHIWEPLAEIEFHPRDISNGRIYCLFSRAFVRSEIKNEWEEFVRRKLFQCEIEKKSCLVKYLEEENMKSQYAKSKSEVETLSGYYSASHYSTDDNDSGMKTKLDQNLYKEQISSNVVQNSDSGADLSEHFTERTNLESQNPVNDSFEKSKLNVYLEWEKFWSKHGENIIWKSWISKFGAYINPSYLKQRSSILLSGNSNEITSINLDEFICKVDNDSTRDADSNICERDISSIETIKEDTFKGTMEELPNLKISTYSSSSNLSDLGESNNRDMYIDDSDVEEPILKSNSFGSYSSYEKFKCIGSDEDKIKNENERVQSCCSNTNLSVKSIANTTVTTDSMTNVTKITLSSLDLSYECESVKSSSFLSTSSDDSSGPSSRSISSCKEEEINTEADNWWKIVWREHYQQLYEFSLQKFINSYVSQENKISETEFNIDNNIENKPLGKTPEKRNAWESKKINEYSSKNEVFSMRQYFNSVSYCLERLEKCHTPSDKNEPGCDSSYQIPSSESVLILDTDANGQCEVKSASQSSTKNDVNHKEEIRRKRREKIYQKTLTNGKKESPNKKLNKVNVKQAMTLMGFSFHENSEAVKYGHVTMRKKNIRGQNRRLIFTNPMTRKHLFFDEDGSILGDWDEDFQMQNSFQEDNEYETKRDETSVKDSELLGYEAHSSSLEETNSVTEEIKKPRKKKKKCKKFGGLPQEITENKNLLKYWLRRYQLFSLFDQGIKLDAESWFSVTPENLAKHHAERCRCDLIVDAFCGAGGNSIQFAFTCERVIAIDIDPEKVKMAQHNARVYGVEDRIEFIIGDFTRLAADLRGDVVFLSPPWGGPDYNSHRVYDLDSILPPLGGRQLFRLATGVANNVAFFLPKNADSSDLAMLTGPGGEVEIEQNFTDRRLRSLTAYFGGLIMDPDDPYI